VRVLYVIDSLIYGGTERSVMILTPPLIERGVEMDVAYLFERPGLHDGFRAAGAQLFSLAGSGGRLSRARRVRGLIAERKPDLVHTSLFEANVAGRIAGRWAHVPVVTSLTGESYGPEQLADPSLSTWKVRAAQATDALTARTVARFHAVSSHVAEVMSQRLRIRPDRIEVIPRGRDPEVLGRRTPERSASVRAGLGIDPAERLVLAAGRHEHQKGLDILIEAFPEVLKRVPEARLMIAGREGNKTPLLRELIAMRKLEGRVTLLGRRDDVPDLLAAADVFVLPSRWEGFPGVVVEAMALEAPIVATDLSGVREAAGDTGADLVPSEDRGALSDAIVRALKDPPEDRSRRARQRFLDELTIDGVAERTVRFYRSVADAHGRTSAVPPKDNAVEGGQTRE
jgi:glycosyltransferase involved in cell wall biosynthesis